MLILDRSRQTIQAIFALLAIVACPGSFILRRTNIPIIINVSTSVEIRAWINWGRKHLRLASADSHRMYQSGYPIVITQFGIDAFPPASSYLIISIGTSRTYQLPLENNPFPILRSTVDLNSPSTKSVSYMSNDAWDPNAYNKVASFVYSNKFTAPVLELLDARPGERILDIGCGTGELSLELRRIVGHDGIVLGVDASESMAS